MTDLDSLLVEVRNCQTCIGSLPQPPRPVLQCSATARILIAGQAPGRKVAASGIPFDDPSGERLREWMGIERDLFYDAGKIAILPMGFCYPGSGKSGDLPPRPECAAQWRAKLLALMPQVQLTLVLGGHAQRYHFENAALSVTQQVKSWRDHWPRMLLLPHPSPRNNRWLKQNPWFEAEVLPRLRTRLNEILQGLHR